MWFMFYSLHVTINFTKNINETQYLLFYKLLYIIDLSIFNIPYKTRHFEDRVSFFEKLCVCKGVSVYKMKPEVIYPKTFAVFITNYFIGYNSAPFSQWNNLLQTTLEFCYVVHWIVVYWSAGAIYFIVQHITKDINCSVPASDEIEYCR